MPASKTDDKSNRDINQIPRGDDLIAEKGKNDNKKTEILRSNNAWCAYAMPVSCQAGLPSQKLHGWNTHNPTLREKRVLPSPSAHAGERDNYEEASVTCGVKAPWQLQCQALQEPELEQRFAEKKQEQGTALAPWLELLYDRR